MEKVVTVTVNPTIDVSARTAHVSPEHKLRCSSATFEPGGGGINVTRAIARLGGESVAVYTAGGVFGALLENLLTAEKITHIPVHVKENTRESLMVLDEASNQQYRFSLPGPTLLEEEIQSCLEQIASIDPPPSYVVASGSVPSGTSMDFYARLAEVARSMDARMIVDSSGDALREAVETGVYLIKPNIRELQELTGGELDDEDSVGKAALRFVRQSKVTAVVVSFGAGGVLMATEDGLGRWRAPTVPIRSKVGAGDSMVGGIVLRLAQGDTIVEAVKFGMCAGSAAVMTPGTELCRREDTEKLCTSTHEFSYSTVNA